MQAVILAGGLGTRLRGVLPDLPKVMAPVRGRPFLEYLLRQLAEQNVGDIVLCVGHRAAAIEEYFGDGARWGVKLEYSREQELRGTAGALKLTQPFLASPEFLLLNGDCYNAVDLDAALAAHRSTRASATIIAARVVNRARFGSLTLDDRSRRVLGFEEKCGATGPGFINGGYAVLDSRVLDLIPSGVACSLEHNIYPRLVAEKKLFAFPHHGAFIDIGVPDDWQRAGTVLPVIE